MNGLKALFEADRDAEATERIIAGYACERPVTLRINTLKLSAEEGKRALSEAGFSFKEVPWSPCALIMDCREEALRRTALYEEGKIYLQSLSSMLPPLFLAPKAGESILDMTAAPGGKTTQLAALSGGKALITACERDKLRFERLKFNLERQGTTRATAIAMDALLLDEFLKFDKILLDAPCSGSGTVSLKKPARIDAAYVEKCAVLQEKLLKKALKLLKKGGELIYSTCSVMKREDEDVVERAIKGGDAHIEPLSLSEDIPVLNEKKGMPCIPPTELFEGFFIAKLIKD